MVKVDRFNAAHCKVRVSDFNISREIKEFFSYEIDGAKYHPLVKARKWDGRISLFDASTGLLYNGLIPHLKQFCKERDIPCDVTFTDSNSVELEDIEDFIESLRISNSHAEELQLRDYQIQAVADAIKNKRIIIKSPTSSGKSAIIFAVIRWLFENGQKVLLVVPNISLINQMYNDFIEYSLLSGWDVEKNVHKVFAGQEKNDENKQIILSTYQSIAKLPKSFFSVFDAVLVDECHGSTGASMRNIMEKCTNAWYRIGTTGTIDVRGNKVKTNKLVLQGLFGFIKEVISTRELMDNGMVADLSIKLMHLKYPDDVRRKYCKSEYQTEMNYICTNENRNKFICNLAAEQKKNTLILTQYVDNQGKILYDMLRERFGDKRNVYFVSGAMKGDEREEIRAKMELEQDAVLIATVQTMGTGSNIKNIHTYISASPSKSIVRVLQTIGRVLRISDTKKSAIMFDIFDDLSFGKSLNHTSRHANERISIYKEQRFKFNLVTIPFKSE